MEGTARESTQARAPVGVPCRRAPSAGERATSARGRDRRDERRLSAAVAGSARTSGPGPAVRGCGPRYDAGRRPRGARRARRPRAQRHPLVLLLAGLRARARAPRPRRCSTGSRDFLDAHVELGLGTIPTFIVGHMSGRELGSRLAAGARPLPGRLARLAAGLVRGGDRRAASARIPRSSAGSSRTRCRSTAGPATSEEITAWARIVVQAVRSTGATQPISLGDGAWGVEVSGHDNGYSLRELAPLVDFVGPHVYPMQDDQVRQVLTAAFACELSGSFGKPVVLEEFGVTLRLRRRRRTRPTTTGRCCTRRCSPAPAAGSRGTTATTTTCATRIRIATTCSRCTSG